MNKFWKFCLKLITGLVVALLLIELVLQALGYFERLGNRPSKRLARDENLIRIVALGESTTAEDSSGNSQSWPFQLQRLFDQNKDKVRVYNLAIPATTTNMILARFKHQLAIYRPHLVISMMGINDSNLWLVEKQKSLFEHLMLYKLLGWLRSSLEHKTELPKKIIHPLMVLKNKDWEQFPAKKNILNLLNQQKVDEALNLIESSTMAFSEQEKAQLYTYLANRFLPGPQEEAKSFLISYRLFQLSLKHYFWVDSTIENFSYTLAALHKDQECLELARRYLATQSEMNDFFLTMISHCSAQNTNSDQWRDIFKALPYDFDFKVHEKRMQTTKNNYRSLHHLLTENNVKMIAMQYPTQNVNILKFYFQDHPDYRIVYPPFDNIDFVSNEENFQLALKKYKYEQLFTDNFAGHFGHATKLGNALIAKAAYDEIKKHLSELKHVP